MAKGQFDGSFFSGGGSSDSYTKKKQTEYEEWKANLAAKIELDSVKKGSENKKNESFATRAKNVAKGAGNVVKEVAGAVTSNVKQNYTGGQELLKEVSGVNAKEEEARNAINFAVSSKLKELRKDPAKNKAEIDKLVGEQRKLFSDTNKQIDESIKRADPIKNAAAAAGTFTDIATLGTGTAVKQGGKVGAKVIADKVAQNALQGGVSGVYDTLTMQGKDASAGDIAKGAGLGAAVGGAIPLVGETFSTAKKAITGKGTKQLAQKAAVDAAEKVSKLSPEEYAAQFSVPVEQATKDLADLAAGKTDITSTGVKAKIRSIFNPVANLGEDTQKAFQKNAGGRAVAEQKGKYVKATLKEAAEASDTKLDLDLARQIEDGTAPDNEFTRQFRAIADKTRQEANDAGLDIGYRENYVPHIWEKSPEEVDKIARGAGQKARAEGERVIPTYQEGIDLGLKPKYKDPADMMGDYVKNLENTRTSVALLTDLKQQKLVKSGRPPSGWKTITAEGFPRTAEGNMLSAPKEVADVLNNIYGKSDSLIDKALRKTAGFNSKWQDIALAGGVPLTPANFFTFSQSMKEGALGVGQLVTGSPIKGAKTIYSPVSAFVRSFSDKQTQKFAKANSGFIQSMAKRGANISFNESDGKVWSKLFNEPTFSRFMPQLQLNTAKNIFNSASKKIGKEEAMDLAAETIKKMYGITDQLATGRSQAVQDLIGTVGFAPKYRESIINVLGNTVKSLSPSTYADKSYSLNRRLAVGLGATFAIYDQINRQTTGHGMADNPEGKELNLAIPYGGKDEKGNQKVVYIPFMPSFMTLPRAAVGAVKGVVKGDMDAVTAEAGKFLSMPLQTYSQIAANKDYFGNPIVIDESTAQSERVEEDSNLAKFGKRAGYVIGQGLPAIPRAIKGAIEGKPVEQNIATAAEAPLRFGKFSEKSNEKASYSPGEVTDEFFKAYQPANAKKIKVSEEVTDLIKQGKTNEAKRKANEYNETLKTRFSKYYDKYGSNPSDDEMWDEMLTGLFIKTGDRSFKARAKQD